MNKVTWSLQILLALAFAGSGVIKLVTPHAELLQNPMMGWATEFSALQIKLIGAAEVAGAIGLILPAAMGIAPILTPLAAASLAVLMAGAVFTHVRRGEPFVPPLVLALVSLLVAYLRIRLNRPAATGRAGR